jgi:hypothetical protein
MIAFCSPDVTQYLKYFSPENKVFMSMIMANEFKDYRDVSKLLIAASEVMAANAVSVGNGIRYLDPKIANSVCENPIFDCNFMNKIDSDVNLWLSMMTILINAYEGKNVIIEYDNENDFNNIVVESLIKILQEEYECKSYIVNDIQDIYDDDKISRELGESCSVPEIGSNGLLKLDEDRKIYQELIFNNKTNYAIGDMPQQMC